MSEKDQEKGQMERILQAYEEKKSNNSISLRSLSNKYKVPNSSLSSIFKKLDEGTLTEEQVREGPEGMITSSKANEVFRDVLSKETRILTSQALEVGVVMVKRYRAILESLTYNEKMSTEDAIREIMTWYDNKPQVEMEFDKNVRLLERSRELLEDAQRKADVGYRSEILVNALLQLYREVINARAWGIEIDEVLIQKSFKTSILKMFEEMDEKLVLEVEAV